MASGPAHDPALPPVLDRQLADGAADEVSARVGELGEAASIPHVPYRWALQPLFRPSPARPARGRPPSRLAQHLDAGQSPFGSPPGGHQRIAPCPLRRLHEREHALVHVEEAGESRHVLSSEGAVSREHLAHRGHRDFGGGSDRGLRDLFLLDEEREHLDVRHGANPTLLFHGPLVDVSENVEGGGLRVGVDVLSIDEGIMS